MTADVRGTADGYGDGLYVTQLPGTSTSFRNYYENSWGYSLANHHVDSLGETYLTWAVNIEKEFLTFKGYSTSTPKNIASSDRFSSNCKKL